MRNYNRKILCIAILLWMVGMLIPGMVLAQSENAVNRVVAVSETYKGYLRTDLTIMENDDAMEDFQAGDVFLLQLPAGVKWYTDPVSGKATFDSDNILCTNCGVTSALRTDQVVEITLTETAAGLRDRMEIPLVIDVNGYLGDITVAVDPLDSAITAGEYLFAQVPYKEVRVPVPAPVPEPQPVLKTALFQIGNLSYAINGKMQPTMDVAPYLKGERAYLPLRFAAYALGIDEEYIRWDGSNQTVTLYKDGQSVQVKIGSNMLVVDGSSRVMDIVPEIFQGRTMLPITPIAEAFGASVAWDESQQSVAITF